MTKEMADMPSPAMQDSIDALRDRQKASANQAKPTLERRPAFTPPGSPLPGA
jgi:hypothetical protein